MGLISRRQLLGGTAAGVVVLGAGAAGVAVGASRRQPTVHRVAPTMLTDALAREDALLAGLSAALTADPSRQAALAPVLADHQAHRATLQTMVEEASSPLPTATASSPTTPAPSTAELVAAEKAAQTAAASASAASSGAQAALFASISACEAGHVGLLS